MHHIMRGITVRLDDKLEADLEKVKVNLGLNNDAEVLRFLIKDAAKKIKENDD